MNEPAKKILVVEDEVDAAFILSRRLIHAGYDVTIAHDGTMALEKIKHHAPDLVLLDMLMPAGGGLGFLKALRLSTKTSTIPVFIITGCKDEQLKVRAMNLGAQHYIQKPYDLSSLLKAVHRSIFGTEAPEEVLTPKVTPPTPVEPSVKHRTAPEGGMNKVILIVDDEEDILDVLSMRVRGAGYRIVTAKDGEEALTKVFTFRPDLIVLDIHLPKINGWYVAMNLKKDEAYKNIPIILLSGLIEGNSEAEKGIDRCEYLMQKPFKADELLRKISELIHP